MTPRPGDRVQITCEGVVKRFDASGSAVILLEGATDDADALATVLTYGERTAPTFHLEVIPRALEVVSFKGHDGLRGDVLWSDARHALVRWCGLIAPSMHPLSDLKPLEPSDVG